MRFLKLMTAQGDDLRMGNPRQLKTREAGREVSYKWEICGFAIGLLLIHSVLLIPTYHGDHFDAATMGVFGDFIGGYVGQLIALTGLCFLIATFRTEYVRSRRERFEGRYFELLQLHRDNVEEMDLKGEKGRKAFVLMLREWRWILNILRFEAQQNNKTVTQLELIQAAYLCMFYGVGPNSSRMLKNALAFLDDEFVAIIEVSLNSRALKKLVKKDRELTYMPFEGHQSRLGHYYRHLFQMVTFVKSNAMSEAATKEHMRTIRAQLSTHEQALLLLNSLTPMGAPWWNRNLIRKYDLVHNIPQDFFEPRLELNPAGLLGQDYFERPEKHNEKFDELEVPFERAEYGDEAIWKGPRSSS